jgi:serine/threonine protein kinase
MENSKKEKIKILIWLNGKTEKNAYELTIPKEINTLKKLKDLIIYEKKYSKSSFNKMKIYNNKEIEIDDTEVGNLQSNDILYLDLEGNKFTQLNFLNQYEIIKFIKSGGYGEVLLSKNKITKELVSIKKIDLKGFSPEDLYSISRESIYLSNLVHKNIIKIYGSFAYKNYLYNIMPYCEGGELTQLINPNNYLSEKRIKEIFIQIVEGVKFIHGNNVIHRDLKPNNILFLDKEKTKVVIIDFGLSGFSNGLIKEVIKAGTFKFLSPEILCRENFSSSSKIDIWALGVILYLMNFKKYPFEGNNEKEIFDKIENEDIKFPKEIKIKKSLVNLFKGMFEKNPKRRIDINDKLFDLWFKDNSDDYIVFSKFKKEKKFRVIPDRNNIEKVNLPNYCRLTTCIKRKSVDGNAKGDRSD